MPLKVEIWGGMHDGKQFLIPDAIDQESGVVIEEPVNMEMLLKVQDSFKKTEERTKILGEIKELMDADPMAKLIEAKG